MDKTLATATSSDLTADFGFAPPTSIGDTVYQDINRNGTQDLNEPGINGVTVTLHTFVDSNSNGRYDPSESGTLTSTGQTATTATVGGKSGIYQFDGLEPGYYVVQPTPPMGSTLTADPNTDGFSWMI
jgi:protocatechuate 3,4-dioxygenase beta subunit